MTVWCPPLTHAARTTLLERVCRYYAVTPDRVLGRSRATPVTHARQLTMALLVGAGLTIADASRFVNCDHSTGCWALRRVRTAEHFREPWDDLVASIIPGAVSLEAGIAAALATLPSPEAARVVVYLDACVRGTRRRLPLATDAYAALAALRKRPAMVARIARCLEAHDEGGAAALLRARCARVGRVA